MSLVSWLLEHRTPRQMAHELKTMAAELMGLKNRVKHLEVENFWLRAKPPLIVKMTEMQESNGNITYSVLLLRSEDQSPWDGHTVYTDRIKGRAEYERDSLLHFLSQGPEPDILNYETDPE